MNTHLLIGICLVGLFLTVSCHENVESGRLIFKGVKSIPAQKSVAFEDENEQAINTHRMHTADLKLDILDIWASTELVVEGVSDNFVWHKIGEGNGLKSVEAIELIAENMPVGDYRSLKINFVNTIVRVAVYQSDINKTVDMPGSLDEESCGNSTIITQYFSKNGNHSLTEDRVFHCNSKGERIRGFKVNAGETTTIYWQLGGPTSKLTDCIFTWADYNNNNLFECDVDALGDFECFNAEPMWSFGIDDGEPEPIINNAVTDIDGNSYNAVRIGDQIWMKENLRTTRLNNGTVIQKREDYKKYMETHTPLPPLPLPQDPPLLAIPNYQTGTVAPYGLLYSFTTINTGMLCPSGWHVPSDAEWSILESHLGVSVGGKLKSTDNYWLHPNQGASNDSEFSAQPGGAILGSINQLDYTYEGEGYVSYFWTSTDGWARYLMNNSVDLGKIQYPTTGAVGEDTFLGCRCVKD